MLEIEIVVQSNKVLGSYDSWRFCPIAPLPAPNVYLMGPDKSRHSMGQSSWSAHSYGRSLMQGYSQKLPVKLPWPRPTNPSRSCQRKMPSALNLPDSCRLTRFVIGKHGPKATTLPPLNKLRDLALGAQLGLFAWPEELSPRILDRLRRRLKVQGFQPLPIDFRNPQGRFECPLCLDGRDFIQCNRFAKHLSLKH